MSIDLLALRDETPLVLTAPQGAPFEVRLANRAPSGLYRVVADWLVAPDAPQKPPTGALHKSYDLPPPFASEFARFPLPPPCLDLQNQANEALRTHEEARVPEVLRALDKGLQRQDCPRLQWFLTNAKDRTRPPLQGNYTLFPGDELKIVVQRLDPGTRSVQRTWRAVVRAQVPRHGWAHANEEEWIVSEIAADIAEMVLFARTEGMPHLKTLQFRVATLEAVSGARPVFRITLRPEAAPAVDNRVAIEDHVWSPAAYAGYAASLLAGGGRRPSPSSSDGSALRALTDLRSVVLEQESQRVSRWLGGSMLDGRAHAQAACVLGALGLRERADSFSDTRRVLCRMTAHLSLARVLRGDAAPDTDERHAEALLLTLAGRQSEALDRLAALETDGSAQPAWLRALRMRNTQDWRLLPEREDATLVEQLEYFRALQASLGSSKAMEFFESREREPVADWGRIALQGSFSVEEGNTFASASLGLELSELADVWRSVSGQDLTSAGTVAALNERAGRCIGGLPDGLPGGRTGPRVIDRGTWAESFQRHAAAAIAWMELHLDSVLGLSEEATSYLKQAQQAFGALRLFPLVVRGIEARAYGTQVSRQLRGSPSPGVVAVKEETCERDVRLVRESPELVTAESWELLERTCPREKAAGTLPDLRRWFSTDVPTGTAYEAASRLMVGELRPRFDLSRVDGLRRLAPRNLTVLQAYEALKFGPKPTAEQLGEIYGELQHYNVTVMLRLANLVQDDVAEYRRWYEKLAAIDADHYIALAGYLDDRGLVDEAAAALEQAVLKARDSVSLSHRLPILMHYYFDSGRTEDAERIARLAADVGSGTGLRAMGQLMERMGRLEEAEAWYRRLAERYDDETVLPCFYLRREHREGSGRYRTQAQEALPKLFPQGLERVSLADMSAPPRFGEAYAIGPSEMTDKHRRFGLQQGDLVLGLDGYRTRNAEEYVCVRTFTDDPTMTALVWRGNRCVEIEGQFTRRRYGP